MNTQSQRLLAHLEAGKTISRLQSLTELGVLELSARICELEKLGYAIQKTWITVTNRFGEEIKVREYCMEK
jgi:hypothetical protein